MKLQPTLFAVTRYFFSIGLLIGAWAILVVALGIPPYLLPHPIDVIQTLGNDLGYFAAAGLSTFRNALLGGVIGILLGFVAGAIAAFSRKVRWIIEPYLTIFQSFPREAFFPLLAIWLGFGMTPKVVNSILLSSFPMAVVTLNALSDTRDDYLRLMQSWKATRLQTYLFCRLPAAVPQLFGGVRVAMPLALIGAVLGEFLGGSNGLGYIIVSSGSAFRVDRTFAAIVVLAIGGTLLVALIDLLRFTFFKRFYQS